MQPHTAGFKRDDVRKQEHLSTMLQQQRPAYSLSPPQKSVTNQKHSGELQDTLAALQERPAAVFPAVQYQTLTSDSFLFISHIWNKIIRK